MARIANIVSFDGAKASSRDVRGSGSSRRDSGRSRRTGEQTSRRSSENVRRVRYYEEENEEATRSSRSNSRQSGTTSSRRARNASDSRRTARSSDSAQSRNGRTRNNDDRASSERNGRARNGNERASSERTDNERSSKREQRRRERTKARAEKMFDSQFASEQRDAAPEEGAPRAALYEAKMGRNHRKATRMQRASEASPVSAKINPAGWLTNLNVSPRSLKVGTAVLCLILTCVFLYTPAQQYYQSVREHDRLEAEAAILEQRNDSLDFQNDSLASDAGMEDAARQKYGYVAQGDQTAVVTGLSEKTLDTSRDSEGIEANVLSSNVKAPEKWYTPYLDAFFGVS